MSAETLLEIFLPTWIEVGVPNHAVAAPQQAKDSLVSLPKTASERHQRHRRHRGDSSACGQARR